MNFYFIALVGLLLIFICEKAKSENDVYFEKSIIRLLKDRSGILKSEMEIKRTSWFPKNATYVSSSLNEEKINFKTGLGHLKMVDKRNSFPVDYVWVFKNDAKEFYLILKNIKKCFFQKMRYFVEGISTSDTSKLEINYAFGGTITLLEILIDSYEKDKKQVKFSNIENESKINARKCELTIENTRIEYYLEDKNNNTMYPSKIKVFYKNKPVNEITYTKFDPIFNKEKSESLTLPIGYGCSRPIEFNQFYPNVVTSYGRKFRLEHDVTFNHLELENRNLTDCSSCRCCTDELRNFTTRSYSNKMFVDLNENINQIDTIDEYSDKKIKTIYKTDTDIVYKVEDNKCLAYKLEKNHSLNYFYIQDLFVNRPEIFYTENNNYTYLGEHRIDNVNYLVVEKMFSIKFVPSELVFRQNSAFRSKNGIVVNNLLVTHYYTRADYYSDIRYKVPAKIELQLTSLFKFFIYGNMTIDIKTYSTKLDDYEKYDTTKCKNGD